jgi:hypothetical protein
MPSPRHGSIRTPRRLRSMVVALCAQGALVQVWIEKQTVVQIAGVQPYHLLVCDALGLDSSWYAVPSSPKKRQGHSDPLNVG